jgi:hypothetical protein
MCYLMAKVDFFITAGDTLPNLNAQLLDASGVSVNLTGATEVTFQMALDGSGILAVNSAADIVNAPQGDVMYSWQDGDTAAPGSYLAVFKVTQPGGSQTYPPGDFLRVLVIPSLSVAAPQTGPAFATLADVEAVTGRDDVTEVALNIAWSVIEGIIGRPLYEIMMPDILTARDQFWLKSATCWQAAFCADNPDVFSAFDVSTVNQTGQSATYLPDGLIVAPMARRCLKWLTWTKSRSVKIQRPFPYSRVANPTIADDQGAPWGVL